METIYKKLFELRKEIGKISKDLDNPFHKSKYFDINKLLEHVMPLAEKHGLLVMQPINGSEVCTEILDIDSGESLNSRLPLPNEQNPQKLGSAITYYRRYTLQSLLALEAEDDDGNKAPVPQSEKKNEITEWLSEDRYKKYLEEASAEQIEQVLEKYNGKSGKGMKKAYKTALEQRRNELEMIAA